jgi:dihydrofolate reductase
VSELIVLEYASLDGVIQAPGHAAEDPEGGFAHGGWSAPFMGEHRRFMTEAFSTAGAVLLGRKTYEIFAGYWPTVTDERDEIARVLNTVPKYVASTTLQDPSWAPTTVLSRDVPSRVRALKDAPGGKIFVVGSSVLAQTLIEHELVDEFRVWLHPVVLGSGKRLFRPEGPTAELTLVDSRTTASGLAMLTYRPARS